MMELQPEQQKAVDRMGDSMLFYHGLGSGKTFTSIKASSTGNSVNVVTPASLKENYAKELVKAKVATPEKYNITSYEGAVRARPKNADVLVVDEAHRMATSSSKRTQRVLEMAKDHSKRIALTATPIVNAPSDIAPIARFLNPESKIPLSKQEFNKRYVKKVTPGPIMRFFGAREKYKINHRRELEKAFKGRVSYYEGKKEGYPDVKTDYVKVPMTKGQEAIYNVVSKQANPILSYKVRKNIPLTNEELKNANSFLSATRQVSNNPGKYGGTEDSSKVTRAVQDIIDSNKKDKNFKGVLYSNYIDSGSSIVAKRLKENNIPYGVFNGGISGAERKKLIGDYNTGATKMLLISSAGAEGLDLKGTKMVQILDPHWNNNRIRQVEGRAARYQSHAALPENERKVLIKRYLSTTRRGVSADEYMNRLSTSKDNLNRDFLKMLQKEGQ